MSIGLRFIRGGLGLLVFGIFIGFGPIAHYVKGAQYPTGHMFMHNDVAAGRTSFLRFSDPA